MYLLASFVLSFINDHYLAGNPAYGAKEASMISISFALLYAFALHPSAGHFPLRTDLRVARIIRAGSASILPAALLLVSLFLIRIDYAFGLVGIIVAVIGYTLRNALNQVSYIARGEILQKERSELQTIAWNDSLTGLANRLYLDQNLIQIARPNHPLLMPLSVLMIDIDYFKLLNDRYGHPTGDACLRAVADALKGAMARPADILARYGGEEFLAVMVGADGSGALRVAERLRHAVEALNIENLGSPLNRVTVSVGTATALVGDKTGAVGLIAAADRTLYEAKRAGRNQIRGIVLPQVKPFA
jgi:diguanylate cyclase (GGDEF)-like protein